MSLLPSNSILGHLEIFDVYLDYNGPRLFASRNRAGEIFLVSFVDDDDRSESWLYVPISAQRLNTVVAGEIEFRDAYINAERGEVYLVRVDEDGSVLTSTIPAGAIDDALLARPGFRLHLPSIPRVVSAAIAERAKIEQRNILRLDLYPGSGRNEAPARELGELLVSFQGLLEANAQAETDKVSPLGRIPGAILARSELSVVATYPAGSLAVELLSASSTGFAPDSLTADAIADTLDLFRASDDQDKLREKLIHLRVRSASRYRAFLKTLVQNKTELEVEWASPDQKRGGIAAISFAVAESALAAVEQMETTLFEQIEVDAVLIGFNMRKRDYELIDLQKMVSYSGKVSRDAPIQQATVNSRYIAILRQVVGHKRITGEQQIRWQLIGLREPDEPRITAGNR